MLAYFSELVLVRSQDFSRYLRSERGLISIPVAP